MKKKILLIPTHLAGGRGGGIRVYNESLVELFNEDKNFDVCIYKKLPYKSILGNKYTYEELYKDIKKIDPDIIHVNGYASLLVKQIVKIANILKIRVAYTPHWHPFNTMRMSVLKKIHFYIFVRPYVKKVNSVLCINNDEYKYFSIINKSVKLVPHWIRNDVENTEIPNIKNNKKLILFVGNLFYKNKGFDYLKSIPENKYEIHCVGRGDISLRGDMIQHIDVSDNELIQLYRQASLLVVPSHYEAFSYVSLEALCNGTPVVMSDRVRIADYLKNISGYTIFKYGNVEDFLSKIDQTIGKKVDVQKIKERFSKSCAKINYIEFYNNILTD